MSLSLSLLPGCALLRPLFNSLEVSVRLVDGPVVIAVVDRTSKAAREPQVVADKSVSAEGTRGG